MDGFPISTLSWVPEAQIQKLTVELQQMEQQQKRLAELSQHRDEPGGLSREVGFETSTVPEH